MTLSRATDLGRITISNTIFAEWISASFEQDICRDKVWPATKKGRQIGADNKMNINEFASNLSVEPTDDGKNIDIELNIIIKFGTSITRMTDAISDHIAETVYEKNGKKPHQIKIRIAGVKSRQVAKRNLEVMKEYETE